MKKRYQLTLTESVVNHYKSLAAEFGMGPEQMSRAVDDFLKEMVQVFEACKKKGNLTIKGLFEMIGENIQRTVEEIHEVKTPEAKTVAKRKKG